jgi:hypothetical protein
MPVDWAGEGCGSWLLFWFVFCVDCEAPLGC